MFLTEEERNLYKSHISRYESFEVMAASHEAGHAIIWSILISCYPGLAKEYRSKIHAWIKIGQCGGFEGRCVGFRLPGLDDKWRILGSLAGGYFCGLFMNDLYNTTSNTTDTLEWTIRINGGRNDWDKLKQNFRLPGYKRFYYQLLLNTIWTREWVRDLHLKYTLTLLRTHHLVHKKIMPDILRYRVTKEITWKEIIKKKVRN